jgi:hypothetical protein
MKKPSCTLLGLSVSWLLPFACGAAISAFDSTSLLAQSSAQEESIITSAEVDHAAAQEATVVFRHAKPANTPAGLALKQKDIAAAASGAATSTSETGEGTAIDNDGLRFSTDLSYLGGAVVRTAQSHPIYMLPNGRCPIATCWGNPESFLFDLGVSEFIHIVDQYTGLTANNRYTLGKHALMSYTPTPKTKPLTDMDILGFIHKVASSTGQSGYGHIYHVFLPPGQDECFTATDGVCYSPDVPKTFAFCGYHSSADFADIVGHVLYTVEPFQDVPGCSVRPGTSNGQLGDSTYNTLSHETFETITDPDGTAWFNFRAVVLAGAEIGDECSFFKVINTPTTSQAFFDPSIFLIGIHRYGVQPEYANEEHACATNP